MKTKIYSKEGKEVGTIALPEEVFGLPWNGDLVHQVVVSQQANARTPVAHTKDRSDTRGGGRKPWRQKGTGRARHGSIRSPIWRGGGVTFGPRSEKSYKKKINRKMKVKALYTVLSRKLSDGEVLFVDDFTLNELKTSHAKRALSSLSTIDGFRDLTTKKRNAALVTLSKKNENTEKSFRNFGNVAVDEVHNLNPVDVLTYKYLVISNPKESVKFLEDKLKSKAST